MERLCKGTLPKIVICRIRERERCRARSVDHPSYPAEECRELIGAARLERKRHRRLHKSRSERCRAALRAATPSVKLDVQPFKSRYLNALTCSAAVGNVPTHEATTGAKGALFTTAATTKTFTVSGAECTGMLECVTRWRARRRISFAANVSQKPAK